MDNIRDNLQITRAVSYQTCKGFNNNLNNISELITKNNKRIRSYYLLIN